MENASKALIIAGSIILGVLIISLGMIVYNQAEGVTENLDLSEYEIQAFNEKFSRYEGKSVPGADVNNLIEKVVASNTINARNTTGMYITLFYEPEDIPTIVSTKYSFIGVSVRYNNAFPIYGRNLTNDNDAFFKANEKWFLGGISGDVDGIIGGDEDDLEPFKTPKYSLKVKSGFTYQVIMIKNPSSGLIGSIFVGKPGVDY